MATIQGVARDLCREAEFRSAAEGHSDGRTLTGYAAMFGTPTEINSWEGHFFETIRAGAFKKSIRERTPVMQFDHGRHPLIGSIPIGAINELREDESGLYVEGRVSNNWLMQPIRDAIAEGSVSGMSFRFEVVREEWRDASGKVIKEMADVYDLLWMPGDRGPLQRELIELKVRELGPVVFPAYDTTSVSVRARSVADELTQDNEFTGEMRRALARDLAGPSESVDPEMKRDIARALLFTRDDAPVGAKPQDHPESRSDENPQSDSGGEARSDDPADSSSADAPGTAHPSNSDSTPKDDTRLRSDIREIRERMAEVLASIPEDI